MVLLVKVHELWVEFRCQDAVVAEVRKRSMETAEASK
ncbi:hypothetical protein PAA8504_02880 [Palleronia abyssalis]|uniref:Uncharacterized protein n=1 Tax=Palleronia abyssalis TaxID=1501240 RepID=A0A2R8BXY2_9RHOB|nr:hypothetical protein PAA8504_02880 [Palleronia abyssalis]